MSALKTSKISVAFSKTSPFYTVFSYYSNNKQELLKYGCLPKKLKAFIEKLQQKHRVGTKLVLLLILS